MSFVPVMTEVFDATDEYFVNLDTEEGGGTVDPVTRKVEEQEGENERKIPPIGGICIEPETCDYQATIPFTVGVVLRQIDLEIVIPNYEAVKGLRVTLHFIQGDEEVTLEGREIAPPRLYRKVTSPRNRRRRTDDDDDDDGW